MSLICPYCDKTFEVNDILFYADATSTQFVTRISGALNESQMMPASSENEQSVKKTDLESLLSLSATQPFQSGEDTKQNSEESRPGNDESFPLGELVEDTVIKRFLQDYGEGKNFTFHRTARFYGILPADKIGDDKRYGYVENANGTIPSEIIVPSRSREQRRVTNPICPNCHCDLPWKYFNTPNEFRHVVALAGCTAAGKTQYMTVALSDLLRKFKRMSLGNNIELTMCSKWFQDMYMKDFTSAGGLAATEKTMLFPMLLQVTDKKHRTHFITFHDCAGEYTNDGGYLINRPGFRYADSLMLMVDAAQLFGRGLAEGERTSVGDYVDALEPMYSYPELLPKLKRVIVVLTKCDTIIGENSIIREYLPGSNIKMISYSSDLSCHENQVNLQIIMLNSSQLIDMMREHGNANFKQTILTSLNKEYLTENDITVFAVSTYTRSTTSGSFKKVDTINGANFHRLIEPLLFAMNQWDIVGGYFPGSEDPPPPHGGWFGRLFGKK